MFAKDRFKFSHPPKLFLKNDIKNGQKPLGKTAYYDPQQESVTLFITSRHPKDILRSFAHELVHHIQNLRGDLNPEKMGSMGKNYAQDNEHMRNMEKEAYLLGNMCLRDWEDGLSNKDKRRYKLAESKFLKEKNLMKVSELKQIISKLLKEAKAPESEKKDGKAKVKNPGPYMGGARQKAGIDDDGDGVPNKADSDPQDGSKGKETKSKKKKLKSKIKKENKSMTTKITKEYLKETIKDLLQKQINEDESVTTVKLTDDEQNQIRNATNKAEARTKAMKILSQKNLSRDSQSIKKLVDAYYNPQGMTAGGEKFAKDKPTSSGDQEIAPKPTKTPGMEEVNLPEGENALYESRFTPRNNRIFEKLLKEWAK